jgi:hypothetical protein
MGADEEGTLAALKAIRRELGEPKKSPSTAAASSSPGTRPPATGC